MDQKTADVQSVSHKAGIVAFELIDAVDWRRDGECLKAGFGATVEPGRQRMNASPVYALGDMFDSSGDHLGLRTGCPKNSTRIYFPLDLHSAKQDTDAHG